MWMRKRLELCSGCVGNPCRMTVWDLQLCSFQAVCQLLSLDELNVVKDLNQQKIIQHNIVALCIHV